MNETPRLRSAFPVTPQPRRTPVRHGSSSNSRLSSGAKLPDVGNLQPSKPTVESPFIPFETIDAPSQRMYVAGFYTALWIYRIYDFYNLTVDETESLWLFMKWIAVDGVFLFGLPALRIPWLEWSATTMMVLFLVHALVDGVLMFRIPIPLLSGLFALGRMLFDKELAISEHYVKPGSILNNPQLILGRQIINVLPEGSAILDPNPEPRCLDGSRSSLTLPLQINQTNPVLIELMRFDLDGESSELIKFSNSQIKKLQKAAQRFQDPSAPIRLELPIKKTGLYRLSRVQDETKLDVSKTTSESLIVSCPSAQITTESIDRCRGDLSSLAIKVFGSAPLKIKYRRTINDHHPIVSFQTVQPDEFASNVVSLRESDDLSSTARANLERAKSRQIDVPLNEALADGGVWRYSIEEVTDAVGNIVSYERADPAERDGSRGATTEQHLVVHERPRAALKGPNMNKPLLVAAGKSAELPIAYQSTGRAPMADIEHVLEYRYTPNYEPGESAEPVLRKTTLKKQEKLIVRDPGTYSLQSVRTNYCEGEILEPSSCTLINPPPPQIELSHEDLTNKCAGSPIGLRADLRLSGTPPFRVHYSSQRNGEPPQMHSQNINNLRGQIEFKPNREGKYTYKFLKISDDLYQDVALPNGGLQISQDVKPSVSAVFLTSSPNAAVCQGGQLAYDVKLSGEGPWALEYEIVRGGSRVKSRKTDLTQDVQRIETPPLDAGGQYTLMLTSITDGNGCKEILEEQRKFSVRESKPEAAFGSIEKKRMIKSLDYRNASIPLRLSGGEGPWMVNYSRHFNGEIQRYHATITSPNGNGLIEAHGPGRYEITGVRDRSCLGVPSEKGDVAFDIEYIPRPAARLPGVRKEQEGEVYQRNEVCQGDEDYQQVYFSGQPPFHAKYNERFSPASGSRESIKNKQINVLQDSTQIKMDTTDAGAYFYVFNELGDSNYDPDSKAQGLFVLKQTVHARPSATFADAGKVYSFCQGQDHPDHSTKIPIKLTGQPPFAVELELKPQARLSKVQTITVPKIDSHSHNLEIPAEYLKPGTSFFTIRGIRDARSCERRFDSTTAPRVQVSVHDPPSITALEDRVHYCIGERITYTLSGTAPFTINYLFQGKKRSATISSGNTFRRIAEVSGDFIITEVRDSASACPAGSPVDAPDGLSHKIIHDMPSVRISKGRESKIDIHAGGSAEIHLEFGKSGTPPFEFTYTRSENSKKGGKGSHSGRLLETRTLTSDEFAYTLSASEEGTYEVVAIRDRYCSFAKPGADAPWAGSARLLQN